MRRTIRLTLLTMSLLIPHTHPAEAAGLRVYGNWCGPGNSIHNIPPMDPLDGACMRHDLCYATYGIGACGCDVSFMQELRALSYPDPDTETRARAMYDALGMAPCDDPGGRAFKQSLMWNDIATDALSGRASPLDIPGRWMYLLSRSNSYY